MKKQRDVEGNGAGLLTGNGSSEASPAATSKRRQEL